MERRLFCTPQTGAPSHSPHHPLSPRRPATPCALGPVQGEALKTCPSTTWRRGKARRARRARSAPAPVAPRTTPTSPSTRPRRESSMTRHPQTELQPVAPPQHHRRRGGPPTGHMSKPDRTSGRTHPRAKHQPRSERCDRFLRKPHLRPHLPKRTSIAPMPIHRQTMPHFGATISSRLGGGHGTCSGTQDPCHCHNLTELH